MPKKPAAEEKSEEQFLEEMSKSRAISIAILGPEQSTTASVLDIYDLLFVFMVDEEAFAADLKRFAGHARAVFETETPTWDMVFGLFDKYYPNEEK